MGIKISTANNAVPQAPQSASWVASGQDQNSLGPESLGLNINELSTLTSVDNNEQSFINVGITPTTDTIPQQVNVGIENIPNRFSGQLRVYSGGANNSSQ